MLRLVADTNTVVSALLWRGGPHQLFAALDTAEIAFYTSRALLDELAQVLPRRKLARAVSASQKSIDALVADYEALTELVKPRPLRERVGRDPDDEAVIPCALAARADLIVSGDNDLLVLKAHQNIRIVNAATALRIGAAA